MSEPVPDTVPANGATATPAPAPELSPKEKRALREKARREFRASERERLAAEAAAAAPAPEKETTADPSRTDGQRASDAAVFLRGVLFPFLSLLAYPFGYRLKLADFTEAKAREDAACWVPVARRYRFIDLLILWAGVPARIVARVRELVERREPKPEKTS